MDLKNGGQAVITRLLEAYGFKTRQALCDQLKVSTSTMGTRWMRDVFPADWVIQCTIETGASVEWLSFGTGEKFPNETNKNSNENANSANENLLGDVVAVTRKKVIDGNLYDSNFYMLDKAMLPSHLSNPMIIVDDDVSYLADQKNNELTDGTWLVEIEGQVSIKELIRIPVGRVRVTSVPGSASFECGIDDLKPLAKCHYYLLTDV
ncbi:CI repressor [Enterobacter hormaechei subsp. xiangfangensis]|uniref:phage repressor protein CI n=1 Tax=Enterobacter cloacae complex TaxID=354276 RepID=UPI00073704E3|nr:MULTISPECIES: phage repressor protein CI [Enterobacter cloacae complex]KTQ55108.1 CI repressor [Enterobacter hormaechei]KTQ63539.1 CI repressor [Enterobacter hormaechei subsp. xiangfangensis]KTQ66083.1 CI repressor [Enterobacter hormaechei]KTQ71109.1 CI repressor [Enterobacter hormaechei subsp. xiangfangensis]KTQ81285.1 CI repressor [Enterobacter hormaechei]